MADFRLILSDGTRAVNLSDGPTAYLSRGGLDMPPPQVRKSFVASSLSDGARLAASTYEKRPIGIKLHITGTSVSDLKTNVRAIEALLEDARARAKSGYGAQVYLETQWGDAAGESTFFDILRGDLIVPPNYTQHALREGYWIVDAQLRLDCKPFGRRANVDIARETLDNGQGARLIQESYTVDEDGAAVVGGATWVAQTFLTTSAFTATGVAIKSYNAVGSPGTITMALYATLAGKPSGGAIATATIEGDDTPGVIGRAAWLRADFVTPVALLDATTYAIVVSAPAGGPVFDYIAWRVDTTNGYGDGTRVDSVNSGGAWTVDATDDCLFAVYSADTKKNYQDITTAEAHGDVPARLYLKIDPANATGSKKMWVCKRTGTRQTDDLWFEGEDFDSFTNIVGGAHVLEAIGNEDLAGDPSGDFIGRVNVIPTGGVIAANTELARMNYDIASADLPRGQFRVLVRVKTESDDNNDFDHMSWGLGWLYGGRTYTPTEARVEYYQVAADGTWGVLDLGIVNIPPVAESDIVGNADFQLRLYLYATEELTQNELYQFHTDSIFLFPPNEGSVIVDAIAAAEILGIDAISDSPNVFKVDGADNVDDVPDRTGRPFDLGREPTRIYTYRDDDDTVTFDIDTKYQPQQMVI